MSDFAAIEQMVSDLLRNTSPAGRRKLLRAMAKSVQGGQAARIARQQQPDGSPFAPRRPKKQTRKGGVRRQAMFRKLRLARNLQAGSTSDEAWVGFSGRTSRIASVHQEGLEDSPARGQAKVRYARRILLGLTDAEQPAALDLLLDQLSAGL